MRSIAPLIAALGLAAAPLGCLHKATPVQTMTTSAQVPAGMGTVQATRTDNGNTALAVRVKYLAPASKVASDATVYMVWIKPPNGPIQAAGTLPLDSDRAGSLETVAPPYDRFTVTVTPEVNAQVARPAHDPVLTAEVNRQ